MACVGLQAVCPLRMRRGLMGALVTLPLVLTLSWWTLSPQAGTRVEPACAAADLSLQTLVFLHRGDPWVPLGEAP